MTSTFIWIVENVKGQFAHADRLVSNGRYNLVSLSYALIEGVDMVRNVDRQSRKRAVLAATINKYIKVAQPVASDNIANDFDLSPATIRSIFSDLEESG